MWIDQSRSFMNLHICYVHSIAARLPICEIWGFCRQHLATLATPTIRSIQCKHSGLRSFFECYFHIPLPIITKFELGLFFSPINLSVEFGTNPSTILLVIVVTDRQTNAGKNILPRFCGENESRLVVYGI